MEKFVKILHVKETQKCKAEESHKAYMADLHQKLHEAQRSHAVKMRVITDANQY